MFNLHLFIFLFFLFNCKAFNVPWRRLRSKIVQVATDLGGNDNNNDNIEKSSSTTKEIARISRRIEDMKNKMVDMEAEINGIKKEKIIEEEQLKLLDDEYGDEITRIKKEFSRMKERAIEESSEAVLKAKTDAVKEILSLSDNYARAKNVFEPIESEGEENILALYDEINTTFQSVLESDFGLERVEALGQPFDFNFMEAIMAQPSTEFDKDIVSMEYQQGYKIGDKSIRPSMVVVSTGPGPSGVV